MKRKLNQRGGFTLLELLMVVIIVGILASLALPGYYKAAERARAAEAITVLSQIKGSSQRFCMQSGGVAPAAWANLDIENPTTIPALSARWTIPAAPAGIACGAGGGFTMNMTLTRNSGPCTGSTVQLVYPSVPPLQEVRITMAGGCV